MEDNNEIKAPIGLKILCFFVPVVGLIFFCINCNEKPKYAKGCGIAALIGFFTIPLFIFLVIMLISLFIFSQVNSTINSGSGIYPIITEATIIKPIKILITLSKCLFLCFSQDAAYLRA